MLVISKPFSYEDILWVTEQWHNTRSGSLSLHVHNTCVNHDGFGRHKLFLGSFLPLLWKTFAGTKYAPHPLWFSGAQEARVILITQHYDSSYFGLSSKQPGHVTASILRSCSAAGNLMLPDCRTLVSFNSISISNCFQFYFSFKLICWKFSNLIVILMNYV